MAASIAVLSSLFFKGAITALYFLVSSDIPDFMLNLRMSLFPQREAFLRQRPRCPLNASTGRGEHLLKGTSKNSSCQSGLDWDPLLASKRDPFERRVLAVALARLELAGVA